MVQSNQRNHALWWQQGVIYQIYPRSFKDTNSDGIGDLQGIIDHLDYLTWLGVDAIWLSPIYPSPMVDFGYDVADYTDIDPLFGDLATFDTLVEQAHRRNLKVIIDYVPNHTSDQHPWFLASRASCMNPKRDWYVWADPRVDGSPPNNWLGSWGGSAWEWDATTRQYYLHSYHKTMPDLNWRNPAVKAAMFDVVRFWLDRGVDGLRIDSAQRIMKDPDLLDNPPNPNPRAVASAYKSLADYDSQLHIHNKGHPDIHVVYRELRQLLDAYSVPSPRAVSPGDLVALGEIHIFDWPVWASYYGTKLDELHMPLNFGLVGIPWKASAVRQVIDAIEAALLPGAWPNYVLGNHDEKRVATRIGPIQALIGMMLLLTLRGTPTLYYGDEIVMHNVEIPPERILDPWEKSLPGIGLGRDPERTPMQWDASSNAGFCPPSVEPWLPIANDYQQVNVAAQRQDSHSLLSLTHALLKIRRTTPALTKGSYTPVEGVPEDCFVYLRQSGEQRCMVALNFSNEEQRVELPEIGKGRILVSTHLDREETVDMGSCRLRGDEGWVVEIEERV